MDNLNNDNLKNDNLNNDNLTNNIDNNNNKNKNNTNKKNNMWRNILIGLGIVIVCSMIFSDKSHNSTNQTNQQNTQNQKPVENQKPQTKPAPQTEYSIGQTYEKDVFSFTLSNPREENSTFGNDKYLILDAEAVAKKDTPLGITISGLTADGEIINSDIAPMVKDCKPFPFFQNMQAGQKIKGQIGFKISDNKITKIRVQEAGKFITYNL